MKAFLKVVVFLALIVGVAALPHAAALASETQEVLFEFDLLDQGGVAVGEFTASGAVVDAGPAKQTYAFLTDTLIVGTKYLYGKHGTIIIRFKAILQPDGSAAGLFQIIKGTDAYRWMKGDGETHAWMTFKEDGLHLIGYYTGEVYYIDPK